jgi:hypothetical protein
LASFLFRQHLINMFARARLIASHGKQSSTSFEDPASANKFQKMVDKFGPVKALQTLGADPEFSADKFPPRLICTYFRAVAIG